MWVFRLLWDAALHWLQRDANLYAAALAYYAPFAFVPLLALAIYLVGWVVGQETFAAALTAWGQGAAPDLTQLIRTGLENFEFSSTYWGVPFAGVLFLIWIIVTTLGYITRGLHHIWHVSEQGVWRRLSAMVRTLGFFGLLVCYLAILVFTVTLAPELVPATLWHDLLQPFLVFLATTAFFTASFWVLSWQPPRLSSRLIGSVVIASGILFLRTIVSWWIAFTPAVTVFGTAGVLLGLLVWVYALAIIIYYGAAVAYIFDKRYRRQHVS